MSSSASVTAAAAANAAELKRLKLTLAETARAVEEREAVAHTHGLVAHVLAMSRSPRFLDAKQRAVLADGLRAALAHLMALDQKLAAEPIHEEEEEEEEEGEASAPDSAPASPAATTAAPMPMAPPMASAPPKAALPYAVQLTWDVATVSWNMHVEMTRATKLETEAFKMLVPAFDARAHLERLRHFNSPMAVSLEHRFLQRHGDDRMCAARTVRATAAHKSVGLKCVFCSRPIFHKDKDGARAAPAIVAGVPSEAVADQCTFSRRVAHPYHAACAAFLEACGATKCFCAAIEHSISPKTCFVQF